MNRRNMCTDFPYVLMKCRAKHGPYLKSHNYFECIMEGRKKCITPTELDDCKQWRDWEGRGRSLKWIRTWAFWRATGFEHQLCLSVAVGCCEDHTPSLAEWNEVPAQGTARVPTPALLPLLLLLLISKVIVYALLTFLSQNWSRFGLFLAWGLLYIISFGST